MTDQISDRSTKKQTGTSFPQAILSVSREELDDVKLTVKQGLTEEETSLPDDLLGHFFMIAPAGTLDSPAIADTQTVRPSADGWTPLFNGDGMVYRFDFAVGKAKLTNKLMKTPCYYADLATHQQPDLQKLKFRNLGFGRVSVGTANISGVMLGFRNEINTAFVPFKFAGDEQRLLVTWDTGRPFEIHPRSLELIAPIGWTHQWQTLIKLPGAVPPFDQFLTSAHPCFDPEGYGELYTVNVGKSASTLLALSGTVKFRFKELLKLSRKLSHRLWFEIVEYAFKEFDRTKLGEWLFQDNFVYLLRWDGKGVGDITRWELVLDDGSPIEITETLHQMGITKDYIILADTSFKFDMEEVFPFLAMSVLEDLETDTFNTLDFPESPDTNIYIVHRKDLTCDSHGNGHKVTAQKVVIPRPMAHYLVDYDNPDDKITLHTELMCATDPSETLRKTDSSVFEDSAIDASLKKLGGSIVGAMDVSKLGCYVIDVASGKIDAERYAYDREYTWSTSFYTYRNDAPVKQFEDIYWNNWGCWTDILSQHIYNLYHDYKDRTVPVSEVLELTRQGIPSSVCRLHIDRQNGTPEIKLQDRYFFPHNYLGTSTQFIPKANTEGSTEGYIVCVVIHSDSLLSESEANPNWSSNSEIWVLDAANLARGPLYRLSHPKLNLGFTLHTTWLADLGDTNSVRNYDIERDFEELIKQQPHKIKDEVRSLFEKEIYPHFRSDKNEH